MTWTKDDRCGIGVLATGEKDPFIWACRKHDRDYYHAAKSKSANAAKLADDVFELNVRNIMRQAKGWKAPFIRALGWTYIRLVRTFGPRWFRYKHLS